MQAQIQEFLKDQKVLTEQLRSFRSLISSLVPMKEQELKYYKSFA
jgi:hypothetical protein